MAKALFVLFSQKLDRMTQGSNALHDFKEIITKRKFDHYFPVLSPEVDHDLRQSYKGRVYLFKSTL